MRVIGKAEEYVRENTTSQKGRYGVSMIKTAFQRSDVNGVVQRAEKY